MLGAIVGLIHTIMRRVLKMEAGLRFRAVRVLAAAMVFCAVLPTLLLGAIGASQIREEARAEFVRGALALVRVVGFGLDTTLQDARRVLEVCAAAPEVRQWEARKPEARARLIAAARRYALFSNIWLLDPNGEARFSTQDDAAALQGFSPELADNYGGYVSDVYRVGARQTPHIFIVVEVRDDALQKRGFLAAEIDLSRLHAGLESAMGSDGPRDGQQLLIVDSRGRPIYPPSQWSQRSLRQTNPAVDGALSSLKEGVVEYQDAQDEDWIAVYKSMVSYNRHRGVRWGVVLGQPTSVAFAQAERAVWQTAGVAAAMLILALLVAIWLARRLAGPLSELAQYARQLGQRGAHRSPEPDRPLRMRADEIGALARALGSMRDDLLEQRQELERRHEALRSAERLSSVGLLAAGVAHEINNPLTTILGYSELLHEDAPDDHPDKEPLALIASEAERVREIVRGLLDLSRRRQHKVGLDVREVIQRAEALARAGLPMGKIKVTLALPAEPVEVCAERQALLQVWMNLISNAVDALEGVPDAVLELGVAVEASRIRLWIRDNGHGMTDEVQSQLFEPFFTTKDAGKGTGLGMAISRSIIDDHSGQVHVTSKPDQGTLIEIFLPNTTPECAP